MTSKEGKYVCIGCKKRFDKPTEAVANECQPMYNHHYVLKKSVFMIINGKRVYDD